MKEFISLKISLKIKMNIFYLTFGFYVIVLHLKNGAYTQNEQEKKESQCENKIDNYFFQRIDPYTNANRTLSYFHNFEKFQDLQPDCNQTYNTTSVVQFRPKKKILIDENFLSKKIFSPSNLLKLDTLVFYNIKGIDLNSMLIKKQIRTFILMFSEMNIYSNGTLLSECRSNFTRKSQPNILSTFKEIYFRQVIFPTSICSLIFRDSTMINIYFTDITNSLLVKNRLRFVDAYPSLKLEIKSLKRFYLELYYESLTRDTLNLNIFEHAKSLFLIGILTNIEMELLGNFTNLKVIVFKVNNLNEFFQQDNKWMNCLNMKVNVNLSNSNEIKQQLKLNKMFILSIYHTKAFQSFIDFYSYPDEDICLFKDFPHSHLVFPLVYPDKKLECTCTLAWLHLYAFYLKSNFLNEVYSVSGEENQTNIYSDCNQNFAKNLCNFDEIFLKCNIKSFKHDSKGLFRNDVDLMFIIKWLEYILILIVQPILCALAILTNILIILVLRNNKAHKELKNKMYIYALINACLNIVYSIIMLFKLTNTCVFYYSKEYQCSSIYQEKSSQYFKIIGVYFLGNVLKSCSNITYIFFSLSRYLSVSLEIKNRFFIRFSKINIKLFFIVTLVLSTILSTFILFQYEINDVYDYRKEFPFEKRDGKYCLNKLNQSTCLLFKIFKLVNQSLNGVIFLTLSLLIDISLIYLFDKKMKNKIKLESNKEKCEEFKKKKEKVAKMILINSVFYFIAHAPIFVTTLLLIVYSKRMANFCTEKISCDLIIEEAEVFILVSMILNFFIFLCFNKNFRDSFHDVKNRFYKLFKV
jgi:hypothetical protein